MKEYVYEGKLLHSAANRAALSSFASLEEARKNETVLEAVCHMCDSEQNLHLKLGKADAVIPKSEAAIGVEEGLVKDIALISKVGKPVQFIIRRWERTNGRLTAILSRKAVQERCKNEMLAALRAGDIITVRVTHLERFGAFCDIGAGIHSLIPIDMLSVSRISHPSKRLVSGQEIRCVVRSMEENKITLSLRELLGDWEQNAARFRPGQTVKGIVRSVESYGVFIELTPNLAGLSEYCEDVVPGQEVSVYIKSMLPEKMKIKLNIIDSFEQAQEVAPLEYFYEGSHMEYWRYTPENCTKVIETDFGAHK